MKTILRLCLLVSVLSVVTPALQAEDCYRHYDRTYVGLYKNPNRARTYRHTYAGHYVRNDRPYRWEQIYERTTYPRNYFSYGRHMWPDNPKPQTTRSLVRPAGFNPYPGSSEYVRVR
jgi:hypothetical protein